MTTIVRGSWWHDEEHEFDTFDAALECARKLIDAHPNGSVTVLRDDLTLQMTRDASRLVS